MSDDFRYGACPQQVEGIFGSWPKQTPFYFRERHSHWALRVGETGWTPDFLAWGNEGQVIAEGDGYVTADEIDALLTKHLGPWIRLSVKEKPCRCWLSSPPIPHADHCCFADDPTPLPDITPGTPPPCGHRVETEEENRC